MTVDDMAQLPAEIFKALSDPIRWSIIVQMASVDELACSTLESTLTVAKPTISYHTKILYQAGLINVRKSGRNYYYSLRRDALHLLLDDLWALAPTPRPAAGEQDGRAAMGRRRKRGDPGQAASSRKRHGSAEKIEEAVVLTW